MVHEKVGVPNVQFGGHTVVAITVHTRHLLRPPETVALKAARDVPVAHRGVVEFAPGQAVAHFDISIPDDDDWEPVRDFVVQLKKVVEGQGTIGVLDSTIANIVDDDVRLCKHASTCRYS